LVKTGLDRFLEETDKYREKNIALLANHSAVTGECRYIWDILIEKGLNVRRIFSPEHGLFGTEQDQVPVSYQPDTGIELVSLYSDTYDSLFPAKRYIEDIDVIIYDMQDVGSRYYTYIHTMAFFMKAVSGMEMEFIVLDRPNPLGGRVEGPLLQQEFQSFVGVLPVPVRHGLTAGELSLLAADHFDLDINLRVIKTEGWNREMLFPETGLPWIPPSPNMPAFATALVYPGTCLFEGLNVSEGRGTTTPFENFGAPFIDPYYLAGELNSAPLEGVYFRPFYFIPTFHKYRENVVGGAFLHVSDINIFRPFLTGVTIVHTIKRLCPELKFLDDVYEFNTEHPSFDLLAGNSHIRQLLEEGAGMESIEESWMGDEEKFMNMREEYLLY
jgi:uncharacterized protein YbbC (DUF1343 family)